MYRTLSRWLGVVASVVGGLELDGWDVAAVLVQAAVVEPVDPRLLDIGGATTRSASLVIWIIASKGWSLSIIDPSCTAGEQFAAAPYPETHATNGRARIVDNLARPLGIIPNAHVKIVRFELQIRLDT